MALSNESSIQSLHQVLISFFEQVKLCEPSIMGRIDAFNGDVFLEVKSAHLVFSLSGLHQFLFDQSVVSYREFQYSLYQGALNASLGDLGLKIDVYRASGKVVTSLYQLVSIGEVVHQSSESKK